MKSEHGSNSALAFPFAVVVRQSSLVLDVEVGAFSALALARSDATSPGLSFLLVEATAGAADLPFFGSVVDAVAELCTELCAGF